MTETDQARPPYQTRVARTTWLRAQAGGLLRFHVAPGDLLDKGQPISTNFDVYGENLNVLTAPHEGIVLGMTTLPVVKPGEPVCHLAVPTKSIEDIEQSLAESHRQNPHLQVRRDLATNVAVTEHDAQGIAHKPIKLEPDGK